MTPRFAWPTYRDQWDCQVTQFSLDSERHDDVIDSDYLRLKASERVWSVADIEISATTDQPLPAGLTGLTAHVLLACPTTQLRRAYPMAPHSDGSRFDAQICIPRSAVTQKASLTVELVATHNERLRIVGAGVEWALIVEAGEAPRPAGAPPISSAWIDFTSDDAPPEARRSPMSYCYLDLNESPPLLYLNSGIDGFEALIKAENAKLERRRHRDLLGAMIARQVTNSLLRAAIDEIAPGEYGAPATGPSTRILQSACEAMSRELSDTNSVEDLYEKIAALEGNPAATAQFWAEADLVLDRMTGLSDTVMNVCKDVKHV
ncbi:hypothetical protein MCHIJ_32780 [Mycolicibacterium chitae]|uniref:Uncharacterized protein n=1 Tax=Mycolicibacterium chitae TaxID=1792 RepID=A0A3S4RM27_MYCCI|nr:hypothetical protein [Mycolicibacterium chitae]MCV7105306.1 hypothetical protein [Mycolicibacterium chitae]BBZ03841.1 hypothetical protein MCHIJ_32780 [Mycolicibacterium chitae]VEG47492.1 Uncharacterised protein [Mycolicibacterium chitae]